MKFEIFDERGNIVMHTKSKNCIPPKNHLESMKNNGYKFKLDGKLITKKELNNLINQGVSSWKE